MEAYNTFDDEAMAPHPALGIDYEMQPVPEPPDPAVKPSALWAQAVREVIADHPEVVVDGDTRATAERIIAPALDIMAHKGFVVDDHDTATVAESVIEVDDHPTPRLVEAMESMSESTREALRTKAAERFDPTAMVPPDALTVIDMSAHAIPKALGGHGSDTPEFGVSLVPWHDNGVYDQPIYATSDGAASLTGLLVWTMRYMHAVDACDRTRLFIERIEPVTDDADERAAYVWDGTTDAYFDREVLRRALAWYGRGSMRFRTLVIAATMAAITEGGR